MVAIAVDKNQFAGVHGISNADKHIQMEQLGCELRPMPLPFGDYCLVTDQMQETINRRKDKLKKQDLVADIKISVDTKKNLGEVAMNICSSSHERFKDELILAQKIGAKLYILVEESGIRDLNDVSAWANPRMERYNQIKKMHSMGKWKKVPEPKAPPTSGETLAKAMNTCSKKYGVEWVFCSKEATGKMILKLLGVSHNDA